MAIGAVIGGAPPNQPAASRNAPAAAQRVVPFSRAAMKSRAQSVPQTSQLGTAVVTQSHVLPAVGGWNRWIELLVVGTTAGNAANVTFAAEGPWNAISNLLLKDAGQKAIFQTRGYSAYLAETLGGYHLFKPDALTRSYSAVTGAGATGGSFSFSLYINQELARDGIGAYPNMDSSQRLTVEATLNLSANIYGTPPTNAPTVTITPIIHYYSRPAEISYNGEAQATQPPGVGTMQYWREVFAVLPSGAFIQQFPLSGRHLRNIIAIFTDATDVRSDTVNPTSLRVELDNGLWYDTPRGTFDAFTAKFFGIDNPVGIVPILLGTVDPDRVPGGEWGDSWVATATSSQLVIKGTTGAAGKLWLLLNEVEAKGDVFRY